MCMQDGIMRTVGSLSELPDKLDLSRKRGSFGSSKAEKLLGSGISEIYSSARQITSPFSSVLANELYKTRTF